MKSDSISALTLAVYAQARGLGPAVVAREMALDIAESVYRPDVCAHLPGVMNVIADALSRKFVPGTKFAVPSLLREVPETTIPPRGRSWWRTL